MTSTQKNFRLLSLLPSGVLVTCIRNLSFSSRRIHTHVSKYQVKTACKDPPLKSPINSKTFGQPTHESHPHRIKKGEIVPGIQLAEFRQRRNLLLESLKQYSFHNHNGDKILYVVIPSAEKKYMTEKIPYVFRQNSDFLYLSGCLEPDSILVLMSKGTVNDSVLFLRGRDPPSELWDGPRTGVDQAVDLFGVDRSMPTTEFENFTQSFIKENSKCIIWYDYISDVHLGVHKIMQQFLSQAFNKMWESPRPFIHRLRAIKSPAEQELMKSSCSVASQAIKNAMSDSHPWDNEAFIQARVDFYCRMKGAEYLAYPPVIASGNRANIIHYINNDQVVEEGNLVLMDAGCEYHGYCSDITRTWPISGKFSRAQRVLYEVVYSVQTDLIQMCCKFPTLDQLYAAMNKLLATRLMDSGIISNKVQHEDIYKCVHSFCPHHVSHYLGMDVHDTSTLPRSIPVEPGMVITIEPGVYVNSKNQWANPEYHGLGIRIEDDVLLTNSGPYVLTSSCPKHPDDIEKISNL